MDLTTTMLAPIGTWVTTNLPVLLTVLVPVVLSFAGVKYVFNSIKRTVK